MSTHLSWLCWSSLPVLLPLGCNLWVPLGFCGRPRVVWKQLQVAWPWHRHEDRRSRNWRDGVARTAGSEEEPGSQLCRIQTSPAPSTACLGSFEPHKQAWKAPETQAQASLWIFCSGLWMAPGRSSCWLRASTSPSGKWGDKSLEPCFVLQGSP